MEEIQNNESNGMTLSELFQIFFRKIWIIVIITVLITLIGTFYGYKIKDPSYTAYSDIIININTTDGTASGTSQEISTALRIVATAAELPKKPYIINIAKGKVSYDIKKDNIGVDYDTTNLLITISYKSDNSDESRAVVRAIAESIKDFVDNNEDQIKVLKDRIGIAGDAAYGGTVDLTNRLLIAIVSLLLGLVVGVCTALVLELSKTTVRNKKELELLVKKYQVIGIIPEMESKEDVDNETIE